MPDDGASQRTFNRIYGDVAGNVVQAASVGSVHFYGRDAESPPQQLLHDIAEFTGRDEHVQTLRSFVEEGLRGDSSAIVISTLTGKGGIGKTALATHVGHLLRDRFPDGQLYVDLRGVAPGDEVRTAGDVLAEFLLLAASYDEAEEVAERLAAAHLIEAVAETSAGQLRYRFHDLVRAYARDVGRADGGFEEQAGAVDRLVRAYVELTSRALESYEPTGPNAVLQHIPGADSEAWAGQALAGNAADWFADEVLNLVDAVELAARFERWEPTWRLCEVLIPLLEVSSRWSEWEKVVALGLTAATHTGNSLAEAAMLRRRGDLMLYTKRRKKGREDLRKSTDIFRRENALGPCAAALVRLGEAHRYLGTTRRT